MASGSSAASVNRIAKRAGLAVGTVYRYFDNKDHLLRASYMSVKVQLHGAMMQALSDGAGSDGAGSDGEGPRAAIRAMWHAIWIGTRL